MDAVVSEADRQVRSAGRLDPSGCLSATAVDPLGTIHWNLIYMARSQSTGT